MLDACLAKFGNRNRRFDVLRLCFKALNHKLECHIIKPRSWLTLVRSSAGLVKFKCI